MSSEHTNACMPAELSKDHNAAWLYHTSGHLHAQYAVAACAGSRPSDANVGMAPPPAGHCIPEGTSATLTNPAEQQAAQPSPSPAAAAAEAATADFAALLASRPLMSKKDRRRLKRSTQPSRSRASGPPASFVPRCSQACPPPNSPDASSAVHAPRLETAQSSVSAAPIAAATSVPAPEPEGPSSIPPPLPDPGVGLAHSLFEHWHATSLYLRAESATELQTCHS